MNKIIKKVAIVSTILFYIPLYSYSQKILRDDNDDFDINKGKISMLFNTLNDSYIEKLNFFNLTENSIRNILSNLDPFANYLTKEEVQEVKESFYANLFEIHHEEHYFSVLSNDEKIDLSTKRYNDDTYFASYLPIEKSEKEGSIDVSYRINDSISYIKVNKFGNTTASEIENAIEAMPRTKGLILDLRGNGGGIFNQAIATVDIFIPMGVLITYTEGRKSLRTDTHSVSKGAYEKGKLVVLVDEMSASASELVSGALQDWDRATIIGRTTYGKGVVQQQVEFNDGSAVRITIARYHTPCGRVIQRPYNLGSFGAIPHKIDTTNYHSFLKKRVLKAGGGIKPDIFIEKDSSEIYPTWVALVENGKVLPKLLKYLNDNELNIASTYITYDTYTKNYSTPGTLIEDIMGNEIPFSIVRSPQQMDKMRQIISTQLKAAIAQRLWGEGSYYKIINMHKDNKYITTALEVLSN